LKNLVPLHLFRHDEAVPHALYVRAQEQTAEPRSLSCDSQISRGSARALVEGEEKVMSRLAIVAGAIVLSLAVLEFGENQPVTPFTTAEDVGRETAEALQTMQAYTIHQQEEYQQKVGTKLGELAKGIATLQAKAERAGAQGKTELNTMLAELQQKKEATRRHFEALKAASGEAWSDLKAGMEAAMKDLERGYDRAHARFGT
jgi:hypothetical protein